VICGGGGNDTIDAGQGNDVVLAGTGNDTVSGGGGTDSLFGEGGDDTIHGSTPSFGGYGDDFLDGGDGNDVLFGTSRALLFGQPSGGDNVLKGGEGDDELFGQGGRDVLDGGPGDDFVATIGIGPQIPDDVVGVLLCGGARNDDLFGIGPSHQCMDGGAGTDSCSYLYHTNGTQDSTDLGTAIRCESESGTSGRQVSCGCE
jgi:Ca2+-binding RTX toxin-like protein